MGSMGEQNIGIITRDIQIWDYYGLTTQTWDYFGQIFFKIKLSKPKQDRYKTKKFLPLPGHLPATQEKEMLYTLCFLAMIALILVATLGPDCDSVCGDVIISHPFGIGDRCAWNDSFAVTCHPSSSTSPAKPMLTKFNLELIEVHINQDDSSYKLGQITVNMASVRVCADNNSTAKRDRWSSLNLSGSPFHLDTDSNVFASVGCHGNASLYNEAGKVLASCSSTCKPSDQYFTCATKT